MPNSILKAIHCSNVFYIPGPAVEKLLSHDNPVLTLFAGDPRKFHE